jgi:hypothetical protein
MRQYDINGCSPIVAGLFASPDACPATDYVHSRFDAKAAQLAALRDAHVLDRRLHHCHGKGFEPG